jgi:hypothetical protein
MAALTSANVTVTLNQEDVDRSPDGRIGIRTFPVVAFGNSALTYPALGVPMPALGKFGFHFAIKRAYFEQPANGFIYHFDRANHKIRIFNGAGAGSIAVANHVNIALPAPTGNVAAPANHVNIAVPAPANHSHDLVVANGVAMVDGIGVNGSNLVVAANNAVTITGGNATTGGVAAAAVPAPANIANLTHNAPAFTGDTPANLANLTHTVTGAGAAGALVEMDSAVAPAAVVLNMEMVGR